MSTRPAESQASPSRQTTAAGAPRVLVLGANGRFGAAAVAAFAAAGWQVLAQARRAPAALPAGARHVATDLADTDALVREAAGARAVVHAVNPPYTAWRTQALPLARLGVDVAERLGATFLWPGNVYGFGATMPARLREDTPQCPSTVKGRIRFDLEAEIEARTRCPHPTMRAVVIRAGDFFGGGRGSWLDLAVAKDLDRGRLVYPGPLDVPHAWAYLPDLARAFVAAATREDGPAFTCLHFEGHTLTGAQLLAAVERAAGALGLVPARGWQHGGMPWGLIRAGGLLVPMWREIAEMRYLWHVPHALDGEALRAALGPLPATPLDLALQLSLQALGHGSVAPRHHTVAA